MSPASPVVLVLGAIVHQQQHAGVGDRVGQQVEKRLRLGIDPVEVFKGHYQWMIQTLAEHQSFDCVQRAPLAQLRIHCGQRIIAVDDSEQRVQIRERVTQGAVENHGLARYFLAALARVVFSRDLKISVQQVDYGEVR